MTVSVQVPFPGPGKPCPQGESSSLEWLRDALDAVAALGQTFNADVGNAWAPEDVFEASKPALRRLAEFQDMAFFTVDEDGLGFQMVQADPVESRERILQEVGHQTRQGTFSWALYQDRPVLVPGKFLGRWVLLHVLSSPSRVSGMFVASSGEENFFLPDMAQKILSILFQKCAGVMESGALHQELAEYNRNLEETIERRTQELRKSEEAARAASRAKSEFLAKMSHEIRTPINGVLGTNSLLLETELTEEQREYAETGGRSARNLLELVNDILDFSKIEAGQLTLEEVSFDLRGVAEEAVEVMAPRATEKGLELVLHQLPGTPRYLLGDPGRVRQVILNLISNAVKFTEKGYVLVRVDGRQDGPDSRGVTISVEDTGIGIDAKAISRIFEKFEQADTSTTRRFGGTGLGLAITQELVQLMGGETRVSSELGVGSYFEVSLDLPVDESRREVGIRFRPQSRQSAFVLSPNGPLRRSLVDELEDAGIRTAEASSEVGARSLLEGFGPQSFPSLILVDSALGNGPFQAFPRWVRRVNKSDSLALVGLTGGAGGSVELPSDGSFDLFLSKPLLERQIRRVLRVFSGNGRVAPASAEIGDAPSRKKMEGRILLVEDDETNRLMAGAMLKKLGLDFRVATNGLEALEVLEEEVFHLILMDCQMPEMDGFQATAAIRNRGDRKAQTPIVALTASALDGDRERCLRAGMDDYASKPLTLEDLQGALARWLPEVVAEKGPRVDAETLLEDMPFDSAAALHRVGGNRELLQEVGEIFFQAWVEREGQLRAAILEGDAKTVGDVAHKVKGSALSLSAPVVADLAGELESLGLQLRVDEADPVMERLAESVRRFRNAFREELAVEEVAS